jgi:hypothetical protein
MLAEKNFDKMKEIKIFNQTENIFFNINEKDEIFYLK